MSKRKKAPDSELIALDDETGPSRKKKFPTKRRAIIRYFVRLCNDVLLDVLRSGNRRQLALLEKNGRRYYRLIDGSGCFWEMPFLRMNLYIRPREELCVGKKYKTTISETDLEEFPPYVRFDTVAFDYKESYGKEQSITKKAEWIETNLRPLARLLKGSKFEFWAQISNSDHTPQILQHLGNQLLEICNACHSYKFDLLFTPTNGTSAANAIATILQFAPINGSSNIVFDLDLCEMKMDLPIESIANWLNRTFDGTNSSEEKQEARFLQIKISEISNASKMLDHLRKAFNDAKFAARPFTFRFGLCDEAEIDEEIESNKKTGEKLSIKRFEKFSDEESDESEMDDDEETEDKSDSDNATSGECSSEDEDMNEDDEEEDEEEDEDDGDSIMVEVKRTAKKTPKKT